MELLSKEERLKILRTIEVDDEFRHALMGALGYSELLKKFERLEKSQEKTWKEIRKIWEEIKKLRENQERLMEGQERLWKGQEKLWEEVRSLREGQERLWRGQEKLWEEVRSLREGQERLWKGIDSVKRDVADVKRMQERYSLTLEEEANEVITYFLEKRGLKVETSPVTFDEKYEFDIYGVVEGFTIVGEAKIRGSSRQVEKFNERVREAAEKWPEKFSGKVIKVFYCMRAAPNTEEKARELGVWLIVSNKEVTRPNL